MCPISPAEPWLPSKDRVVDNDPAADALVCFHNEECGAERWVGGGRSSRERQRVQVAVQEHAGGEVLGETVDDGKSTHCGNAGATAGTPTVGVVRGGKREADADQRPIGCGRASP